MIRLSSSRRMARSSGDLWDTVASMASRRHACWNACMPHLGCKGQAKLNELNLHQEGFESAAQRAAVSSQFKLGIAWFYNCQSHFALTQSTGHLDSLKMGACG